MKPRRAKPYSRAGWVNASDRNSTSGSIAFTRPMSQCQKSGGLVCGLSTRKTLTPSVTVSGVVDAVSSKTISVRAECEGDIIRVRVWKTGTPEPTDWQLIDTDRTYRAAGWVAVRDGVATGNTNTLPIVFSHNRVEVYSPQYAGEVAKWPPSKSREGADRTVRIEAFDLFHRRRQGQTPPAKSAHE